jgi:hypothetical protein
MKALNLLNGCSVQDNPVANHAGNAGPMHRSKTWRKVPSLKESPHPYGRRLRRQP